MKAAEAARCAGDQGRYWEMHRMIFHNRGRLEKEDLEGFAEGLGLKMAAFKDCLKKGNFREEIQKDIRAGEKAGVRGTPSFVLGTTGRDGSVTGKLITGAQSYEAFERAIDGLLKAKREKK